MNGERFDLAVVGAGPGGAACALAAARSGLFVALFQPPDVAEKPCGEGILPPGVEALERLGLTDVLARGLSFERIRYRVPGRAPLAVPLPRAGVAVRRRDLARALDRAVDAEQRIVRIPLRASLEPAPSGFRLLAGGASVFARTAAVCDGKNGTSAAWLRVPAKRGRRRLGIRRHFAAARRLEDVEVHFGRGSEVYLTPLPGGLVNAAVLTDEAAGGGAEALFERVLARYEAARKALGEPQDEVGALHLGRPRPREVARDGCFLVGDAGGGIDPILGCGVSLALRTGMAAARAARAVVSERSPGEAEREYALAYRRESSARRRLAAVLEHSGRYPALVHGTLTLARLAPRLTRRIAAIAARSPVPLAEWS